MNFMPTPMRRRSRLRAAPWVIVSLALVCRAAGAEQPAPLDLSAWRALPVFDQGRIMPLDSLARSASEKITGRTNPTFDLSAAVPAEELKSPAYAEARRLFPEGKPRKFPAAELLLSWLVEPEKWEDVPFIVATNEELRGKYLGVPLKNAAGEPLKHVSPRQIAEAVAFQQRLEELRQEQAQADDEGRELTLSGVDRKISDLFQAYVLYRTLSLDPTLDPAARGAFQSRLRGVATAWSKLDRSLEMFAQIQDQGGLGEAIAGLQASLEALDQLSQQPSFSLAEGEKVSGDFADAAARVARWFASNEERLLSNPPPQWGADQLEKVRTLFAGLRADTAELSQAADALTQALYDNRERLRVVPALNAAALESGRDPSDTAQPWLDLQTLIFASERGLAGYPAEPLARVRRAFRKLSQSYLAGRTEVSSAAREFSEALAGLGAATEPLRERLEIADRDEELIAYTAYPPAGHTANELRYNELDPFLWSWVITLLSALTFAGVFIFGRGTTALSRRLFWVGLAILAVSLVWSAYGFYLRVSVTRWAPVTNMYETVIYVPFFVCLMGAWLTLIPVMWDGLMNAWRLTACPRTREATELTSEQLRMMNPGAWLRGSWIMQLPRAALSVLLFCVLAVWNYAAGGRKIINLLPDVDAGSTLPTGNDLLTWGVGLVVLVATLWFLPRAILSLGLAPVLVPWTLRSTGRRQVAAEVYPRWPFALAATGVAFFGSYVAWYSPVLDKDFGPLTPVLRDNFWLLIHVLTIVSSYGAGALAWGLGNLGLAYYLLGRYRPPQLALASVTGHRPMDPHGGDGEPTGGNRPPEACAHLAGFVYKAVQVAVLLLAAGTILGALWADVAWGRFWGWDPKEVWALISLLVYVAILHGRFAGWVNNFGLIAGTVLGATAIIMSWYGVNFVLGQGMHSYGFGEDQTANWYVLGVVIANWGFAGAAGVRYWLETRPKGPSPPRRSVVEIAREEPVGAAADD